LVNFIVLSTCYEGIIFNFIGLIFCEIKRDMMPEKELVLVELEDGSIVECKKVKKFGYCKLNL